MRRWDPYALLLQSAKVKITNRLNELAAFNAVTQTVSHGGGARTIKEWCEGPGGVLEEMGGLLAELAAEMKIPRGNSIELWETLSTSKVLEDLMGQEGETTYTHMLDYYNMLVSIVGSAVYVRNAALLLYVKAAGSDINYDNLDDVLTTLGNTRDPRSAWGAFEKKLASLRATKYKDDRVTCARESWENPDGGRDRIKAIEILSRSVANCFLDDCVVVPDDKSYFSGVNLACVEDKGSKLFYLEGTVVTIQPDGRTKVTQNVKPNPLNANRKTAPFRFFENDTGWAHIGTGYVPEPELKGPAYSNNCSNVVTGMRLAKVENHLVIALQYGVLIIDGKGNSRVRIDDPSYRTPTMPFAGGTARLARDMLGVDPAVAGTKSNAPLTNATLVRADDRISVRARTAGTAYEADIFQPTSYIKFSPDVTIAPPANSVAPLTGTWDVKFDDGQMAVLVLTESGGRVEGTYQVDDRTSRVSSLVRDYGFQSRVIMIGVTLSGALRGVKRGGTFMPTKLVGKLELPGNKSRPYAAMLRPTEAQAAPKPQMSFAT
jgi:hypothetical protein